VVREYMSRLPSHLRPLARRARLDVGRTEAERRAHARQLIMVAFRPSLTSHSVVRGLQAG
jgi:hypothetical protein